MTLTRIEMNILKFLAAGFTAEQIANLLGVKPQIVRAQLEIIWRKLGGRTEVVANPME